MVLLHTILLIFAFVCFVLAACNVPQARVNLIALGLAFWVATLIFVGLR